MMAETTGTNRPIETYRDFWPYYLQEHAKPATRTLHFIGTGLAVGAVTAAILTGQAWLGAVALVASYGPAWAAHFFVEKNHPTTNTNHNKTQKTNNQKTNTKHTRHQSDELA